MANGESTFLKRCRVIPLPDRRTAFEIDGKQRICWHHDPKYPRPFFYPMIGPDGQSLTRMGHPGAPNHDHHRSIWFAHANVGGHNFWTDQTDARIRQRQWLCYQDGDDRAVMAVELEWFDGHDPKPLVQHQMIAAVRPTEDGGLELEVQSTFQPIAAHVEFGKTNFGLLGVRVAKSLSVYFGGGQLSDSEARSGEAAIFGQAARWVDYSGPLGSPSDHATEGITYFDHPSNPDYPARWHVRGDGWMIASTCMQRKQVVSRDKPLVVRYLLHAHRGPVDPKVANSKSDDFAMQPPFRLTRSKSPHQQYEIHSED